MSVPLISKGIEINGDRGRTVEALADTAGGGQTHAKPMSVSDLYANKRSMRIFVGQSKQALADTAGGDQIHA
ncbi:hypothetical protein E4U55_006217 [Claviceps digitariae]|nr:hypothetical protein E4U55_006217 [Claviceps digitariae]